MKHSDYYVTEEEKRYQAEFGALLALFMTMIVLRAQNRSYVERLLKNKLMKQERNTGLGLRTHLQQRVKKTNMHQMKQTILR